MIAAVTPQAGPAAFGWKPDMKSAVEKHSVSFGGRRTSISLENAFWNALREIARRRQMTLGEVVENIDTNRTHGNLSSAIRLFVLEVYKDQIAPRSAKKRSAVA
jgi:predicted DNA-binding ribbon-helix-helix protein